MKQILIISIIAVTVVALMMAALGVKMLLHRSKEFRRPCANADPTTGRCAHCTCGRAEKTEDENPTIGILLCREKSDSMVALTLPENSNIYASKYELYLPDKKLLQEKLEEWIDEDADQQ